MQALKRRQKFSRAKRILSIAKEFLDSAFDLARNAFDVADKHRHVDAQSIVVGNYLIASGVWRLGVKRQRWYSTWPSRNPRSECAHLSSLRSSEQRSRVCA
jgi:hypothetical protein